MDEKEIEVVTGDGSTLQFSHVEEHLSDELAPKPKAVTQGIIIPEVTTGDKKKKKKRK